MDFKDLLDTLQAEAISNKLYPTDSAVWRQICRNYSQKFSTPLYLVESMEPEHVVLNFYEDQLEDIDIDDKIQSMMEIIYRIEDPNYESDEEAELQDFIEEAEVREKERLKKGLKPHQLKKLSTKKSLPENEIPVQAPLEGGLNLKYMESEEEGNKNNGF